MPKTASTWLQNAFFAGHPQLAVLGPEDPHRDLTPRFLAAVARLVLGSDLQDVGAVGAELEALVRERAARTPGARLAGLSHEALAGAWPAPRNSGFLARTMAALFPDAKVLLVVREQRAALVSHWREFVRMGGTLSFPRFVFDPAIGDDPVEHALHTAVLGTSTLAPFVRAWRAACGEQRVLVLPFERLQRDPGGFARALCAFLGVDDFAPPPVRANVQLSAAALALLRRCNHLFHTRRHPRFGWQPVARVLSWCGVPRDEAWRDIRQNPWLVRYRISDFGQRWLARKCMPRLDRLGLAMFGKGRDPFPRLRDEQRRFLEAHFAADTRALRALVDWEPEQYGYLGGA
ncbi:MAG TPA: sulfotransferase [Planctomycetota bacterium]|nr:sulfotransferase [Planctomycetota bacterium]